MANRVIFFVISILILNLKSNAQEQVSFNLIESKTYAFYLSKNLDSLKWYYNLAEQNEIDYYYLRMRVGILEYENAQYLKAIVHFKKALEFYPTDTVAMEYLYFSYLFVNRSNEAFLVQKFFPESMKKRLEINNQIINGIDGDFTYAASNFADFADVKKSKKQNFLYEEVEGIESEMIGNLRFSFRLHHRINADVGTAMINIYNSKYAFDKDKQKFVNDYLTTQYQFYAKPNIQLNGGWLVNSGVSYVYSKQNYPINVYDANSDSYKKSTVEMLFNQYLGFSGLQKYLGNFKLYFGSSVAWLYDQLHVQPDLQVVYFPLHNLDLYFGAAASYHWVENAESQIYQGIAGFRIMKRVWLDGNYYFSSQHLNNYISCQSLAVNDYSGKLTDKWNVGLIIVVNSKLNMRLQYDYHQLETPQWIYTTPTQYSSKFINYQLYFYKGGISWKF